MDFCLVDKQWKNIGGLYWLIDLKVFSVMFKLDKTYDLSMTFQFIIMSILNKVHHSNCTVRLQEIMDNFEILFNVILVNHFYRISSYVVILTFKRNYGHWGQMWHKERRTDRTRQRQKRYRKVYAYIVRKIERETLI